MKDGTFFMKQSGQTNQKHLGLSMSEVSCQQNCRKPNIPERRRQTIRNHTRYKLASRLSMYDHNTFRCASEYCFLSNLMTEVHRSNGLKLAYPHSVAGSSKKQPAYGQLHSELRRAWLLDSEPVLKGLLQLPL